jgi:shikimate dehydrogenase
MSHPVHPSRLVLLGHPVSHSLSPILHAAALATAGIDIGYEAVDVAPQRLEPEMATLVAEGAAGNATIPHKEALARICDRLTPTASLADAVNVWWVEGGELVGDNTDVAGFHALARRVLGCPPGCERVAIIGAGGAASAVLTAIGDWTGSTARVFNRDPERARRLCARFPDVARVETVMEEALAGATIVVNATPIGLLDEGFPVAVERIPERAAVIDLVYRAGDTPWVRAARERGLRAGDGLAMLVEQAALSFQRWFAREPNRQAMWAAVT